MSRTARLTALTAAGALTLSLTAAGAASAAEPKTYKLECNDRGPLSVQWVQATAVLDPAGNVISKTAGLYNLFGGPSTKHPGAADVTVFQRPNGGMVMTLRGSVRIHGLERNRECYASKTTGSVVVP